MKKMIAGLAIAALPMLAFATDLTTGSSTDINSGNCAFLPASAGTAKVTLSKDVTGAYDCSNTGVGIATRHPNGKNKTYSTSNAGGQIVESTAAVGAAATSAKQAGEALNSGS